jgi:hypothetical protein
VRATKFNYRLTAITAVFSWGKGPRQMAGDDYFALTYKILRTLRAALQVEEFDPEQIGHEALGVKPD